MNYKSIVFVFFVAMLMITSVVYGESAIKLTTEENISKNKSLPVISDEELELCEERIRKINQTAQALMSQKKELEKTETNVQSEEQLRDDLRVKLDLHNPEEVLKYNQVNQNLKKISTEYHNRAKTYNEDVKIYQDELQRLKSQCDDKQFIPK